VLSDVWSLPETTFSDETLHLALKHFFGFDEFRLNQLPVIRTLLSGKDVLAIMPTGGGKSVCYQLPAVLLPGLAIVVSPLIALMKDQVDGLTANGIFAAYLNSGQSQDEQRAIINDAREGKLKLLYIAPERIPDDVNLFVNFIKTLQPSLFAIDEAHCISQWGHDFRPDYLKLACIKNALPQIPVIALTASADSVTRTDILDRLNINNAEIFISSFNRANITYMVRPKANAMNHILAYLKIRQNESGIIYALSRSSTEKIADTLRQSGIAASFYHAGMPKEERTRVQEEFQKDNIRVIVATIAFGMGIDKSNVRFVIHHDVPKNIEGYYQETGRAGRDGLKSDAILYYSFGDIVKLRNFVTIEGNPEQSELSKKKLKLMQDFCEHDGCRRQFLMQYFGESFPPFCGNCDFCLDTFEETDVTTDAQKLLSAIARTGQNRNAHYIINFLRGTDRHSILPQHKELKTFAIGQDLNKPQWQWLIEQLLLTGYIDRKNDDYFALTLNSKSEQLLKGEVTLKIPMRKGEVKQTSAAEPDYNAQLMTALTDTRKHIAAQEGVPAYAIVSDKTLQEVAKNMPQNFGDLKNISGLGEFKIKKFGKLLLDVVAKYNPEPGPFVTKYNSKSAKPVRKEKTEKPLITPTQDATYRLFREGKSVSDIAEIRNLSPTTVETHLCIFIQTGVLKITELVTDEKLMRITEAIKASGQSAVLKPIKELLDDSVTFGEIKWVLEHLRLLEAENT
jgi:ATP-dependent DNA helicase RecQ